MGNTFVGIGFGAIQGGLFLYEAFRSGTFDRLVVAEVIPDVVSAVKASGAFQVNIATASGVEQETIEGVEILNPSDPDDYRVLVDAIAEASAMATALPSVDFYEKGDPCVADLLAEGCRRRAQRSAVGSFVIYAAENNNHAAELLDSAVNQRLTEGPAATLKAHGRFLNTVIGKMSQVLADAARIDALGLARVAPGLDRAFLVEAFNRILVTKCDLVPPPATIDVFVEKQDLLPFEEAKLYGHNATHALVGYLAARKGAETMSEALADPDLRAFARDAFLGESGGAIIAKYAGLDPLFTPVGYAAFVDDLIERMANPYLEDRVERIIRDPQRKLGWDDRLIGTIRLAIGAGVEPVRFTQAAEAALRLVDPLVLPDGVGDLLRDLWGSAHMDADEAEAVIGRIAEACREHDCGMGCKC